MRLDVGLARSALTALGTRLGLDLEAVAWGIHDIVNENMAGAARTHIAEKGLDAREFTMVATGGAGPVHGVDVARRLRIRRVLCPVASGVGSCLGFLAAPARSDRSWSRVEALERFDRAGFEQHLESVRAGITADLAACGIEATAIVWRLSAEVRYRGQGNTVEVLISSPELNPIPEAEIARRFEAEYVRLYRKAVPGGVPEVVTWRLSGGSAETIRRYHLGAPERPAGGDAQSGERRMFLPGPRQFQTVPVYERSALDTGTRLTAPLVIAEPESTLVVAHPGTVNVLDSGTVEVLLEESA